MRVRSIFMVKKHTTSGIESFSRVGLDLHLSFTGTRLRAGLTTALRDAIRSGRLEPGVRIPSTRALAEDFGLSRSTVTEAYATLIAEGWLTARHGSGTRVAERRHAPLEKPRPVSDLAARPIQALDPGAADYAEFPRAGWITATKRALAIAPHSAFGYGDALGSLRLRTALAEYLARVRGVRTDPSRIVIVSGFHHGLGIVARALAERGAVSVAVEQYGLHLYRDVLREQGVHTPWLLVDECGARVEALGSDTTAPAVLLTPAHQFPTGFALSPERRTTVLDWARRNGGVILEDDYDGEFRYERTPVGALQGLDPEHVVYFGTTSKSVAPALRLGWVVVPENLLPAVALAKGRMDTVSALDQLVFAELLSSGAFDRHVRSRRQSYRRRREQLIAALAARVSNVRVIGMAAGLQTVILLPEGMEGGVLEAARDRGLLVSGLAEFRHPDAGHDLRWSDGLVVNFSAISDSAWPEALQALCDVLEKASHSSE